MATLAKGANRIAVFRMRVIAAKVIAGKPFTAATVARELELSRKCIHRDMDFMRDFLGYEIEWDGSAGSFFGRAPKERVL